MKTQWSLSLIAAMVLAASAAFAAPNKADITHPITQFYAKRSGVALRAVVYRPEGWKPRELRPAIVIFNALGWTSGQPEWGEAEKAEARSALADQFCVHNQIWCSGDEGQHPADKSGEAQWHH